MISKKSSIELIRSVIRSEAETLNSLSEMQFDSLYASYVHICNNSKKLIFSGVGKSAIVARKLTATFNSTGTPSIYLHAADAAHGDLGIIQSKDTVIVISKSGNSYELEKLIPQIKSRGAFVIGFVSDENSLLARQADILVFIPVLSEAGPFDLAPTSSIVAHIAVGDALALLLQKHIGWNESSFASVHPGGSLGKKLNLRIQDLRDNLVKPSIAIGANIKDVIVEISSKRMGAVAVLQGDKVCGIITDGDLRRMLEISDDFKNFKAEDIMTSSPKIVSSQMLASDVLRLMEKFNISQLLVVDDDIYKGVIHIHDLVKEGL